MTREELRKSKFMNYSELIGSEDCAVKDNRNGTFCLAYQDEPEIDNFDLIDEIHEDVFIRHCNIFKTKISAILQIPFDEWITLDIADRILDVWILWKHGESFLLDCTPEIYPLDKVPCPTKLQDGRIDMDAPQRYLRARERDQEHRSYTKAETRMEVLNTHQQLLAKLWGFSDVDGYYTEYPYRFEIEDLKHTMPGAAVSCAIIHLGKSPNGLFAVSSSISLATQGCGSLPSVYGRYAYPDRESALRAGIHEVREYLADKKQDKYKESISRWLDSLEADMMQPMLFAI